jgi:hypothetical protein
VLIIVGLTLTLTLTRPDLVRAFGRAFEEG